ncbi:MAG: polysaccharide deacetylase family protein [Gemmataceae bacterium]
MEPPPVTILLYHDVLPAGAPCSADPGHIPADRLRTQMEALLNAGFTCLDLATAFARITSKKQLQTEPAFAVTFDDGYAGLHAHLPALASFLRPTVFLLTDHVGQSNMTWNTRSPEVRQHLTLEQIHALDQAGIDFEFHGTDHHNLLKFDTDELGTRFERGCEWFRRYLGRSPSFIAYPYGYCSSTVSQVASRFFAGGFSVTHGDWWGPETRYAINRISVPSYLSGEDLLAVVRAAPSQRWYERERRAPWRGQRPQQVSTGSST